MRQIIRYIPNTLTITRLAAIPVFAWWMIENRLMDAMWLFLLAQATDVLMWVCACTTLFALAMYGRDYLAHRRNA